MSALKINIFHRPLTALPSRYNNKIFHSKEATKKPSGKATVGGVKYFVGIQCFNLNC